MSIAISAWQQLEPQPALAAVLFDLGGTLAWMRYDPKIAEETWSAGLETLRRPGLPTVAETVARFRTQQLPKLVLASGPEEVEYLSLIDELFRSFGVQLGQPELFAFVAAQLATRRRAQVLHPCAPGTLRQVREQGLRVGLVSNASEPAPLMRDELDQLGIGDLFDAIVFSSEVGRRKPDAAPFLRALELLNVEPRHALYVGDDPELDLIGPQRLGMQAVLTLPVGPRRRHIGSTTTGSALPLVALGDVPALVHRIRGGRHG